MTATKTNAREALIAFVLAHGWELDPTRKAWDRRDIWFNGERKQIQHPTAFRRPAHDGLFWSLELDYTVKSDYSKLNGTRLSQIILKLVDGEGTLHKIGPNSYDLSIEIDPKYANSYRTLNSNAWSVTHGIYDHATLKQRAEVIAADPALVVWLALERRAERDREIAAERRRREQDAKLRKRPLEITLPVEDWRAVALELSQTAHTLRSADGLTDLPAAIARAEQAIAVLRDALKVPADAII